MDTKQYNIRLKALKSTRESNVQLNVLRSGDILFENVKEFSSDLRIKLTDSAYTMKFLYTFSYYAATSFPTEDFNTSELTTMNYMFDGCNELTSLDISSFDFNSVTGMSYMFGECGALVEIKGVIDMKDCTDYYGMFDGCSKLTGVKIKNPPAGFDGAGLRADQFEIVE